MPIQESSTSGATALPRHHLPRAEDFLLWPPALQVHGFRVVDRLFSSRKIPRSSQPKPLARGSELEVVYKPADDLLDVDGFMDRNRLSGLLILKEGKVRLERYGLGLQEHERWSTMSTVKTMTAMLAGAAVQDGALNLDEKVTFYLPALAGSAYDDVTIRHVMTMTSGVRWIESYSDKNSDVNKYSKSLADNVPGGVLKLMSGLPGTAAPGSVWNYNTGDTYLLGAVISTATGESLADYMHKKIWEPCGMEFDAFYTLESEGGQEIGGSRAGVALRDFGRFAQFVLDDGVINGSRILPLGWVDDASRIAHYFSHDDYVNLPRLGSNNLIGYGYSVWIDEEGALIANGFAGQRIYINRHENFAMITLGAFPQAPYAGPGEHDHIADVVLFTHAARKILAIESASSG
jgi:CubicO group peptidase (beta-lactamase class C family)